MRWGIAPAKARGEHSRLATCPHHGTSQPQGAGWERLPSGVRPIPSDHPAELPLDPRPSLQAIPLFLHDGAAPNSKAVLSLFQNKFIGKRRPSGLYPP